MVTYAVQHTNMRVGYFSLNPYCSGRWSRTLKIQTISTQQLVLILIVVEDGHVRFDPTSVEFWDAVLILIVVEDGHVLSTWISLFLSLNVLILIVVEDGHVRFV